ncbi:MAG: hypothetical protein ACRDFB_00550 [Rhabdochlamydiaceae bacterium]
MHTISVTRSQLLELELFSNNQKGYNAAGAWLKQLAKEGKATCIGRAIFQPGSRQQGGLAHRGELKKPGLREVWEVAAECFPTNKQGKITLVKPKPQAVQQAALPAMAAETIN